MMLAESDVPGCFSLTEAGTPCKGKIVPHKGSLLCAMHHHQYGACQVTLGELLDRAGLVNEVQFDSAVAVLFSKGSTLARVVEAVGDTSLAVRSMRYLSDIRVRFQAWIRENADKMGLRYNVPLVSNAVKALTANPPAAPQELEGISNLSIE